MSVSKRDLPLVALQGRARTLLQLHAATCLVGRISRFNAMNLFPVFLYEELLLVLIRSYPARSHGLYYHGTFLSKSVV